MLNKYCGHIRDVVKRSLDAQRETRTAFYEACSTADGDIPDEGDRLQIVEMDKLIEDLEKVDRLINLHEERG